VSEKWLPITGYEGRYEVSDCGRVRSFVAGNARLLRPLLRRGYPSVDLYDGDGNNAWVTVHSIVAAAFIGPRPLGAHVNHKSGVKTENAATNLEYCTQSENMKHAFRIGLQSNKGERHSQAVLTDQGVRQIRALIASGMTQAKVAKMMNIDQSAVSRANSGKRWGHVTNVVGCEMAKNQLAAG